jgi:hypothetical protein
LEGFFSRNTAALASRICDQPFGRRHGAISQRAHLADALATKGLNIQSSNRPHRSSDYLLLKTVGGDQIDIKFDDRTGSGTARVV